MATDGNEPSRRRRGDIIKLQMQNRQIIGKLDQLILAVHGEPGCTDSVGLMTRVDRLETMQKIHMWVIRTIGTALAGVVAERLIHYWKVL